MTDHPTFDQLCDLHDDALDVATATAVRAHLESCASCAEQVALLDTLAEETTALPRGMAPPDGLWSDIKAEIAPSRTLRRAHVAGWSVRQLAAAGVLIALGSSALTVALTRRAHDAPAQATADAGAPAPSRAPVVLPASLASEESGFTRSVDVLQRTLDGRRDSLAPSTIATVERSLRVADSAIAEARDALARDPSNRALAKLFASNYERKIDLLRRATELAPRT
jgi:hypothetical protein